MPMFHVCFGCGRSVGVKLVPCHKCHAVYFCSTECMRNAAAAGHSALCPRVAGWTSFLLISQLLPYLCIHALRVILVRAETNINEISFYIATRDDQWHKRQAYNCCNQSGELCCLVATSWQSLHDKRAQQDARGSHLQTLHVKHLTPSYSSLRRRVPSGSLKVQKCFCLVVYEYKNVGKIV